MSWRSRMLVSVIVPVLDDTAAAERLVRRMAPDPRLEVILVDGAADPRLAELTATRPDVQVIRSVPGRARQMNEGARAARGEWLLFLHADSAVPPEWLDVFERAVNPAQSDHSTPRMPVGGGWFQFALDHAAWQARVVELGVRWRVRLLRLPYGDQGLFARRAVFDGLGGYRDLPLMEDVDFARRLSARESVIELPLALRTSARRWEQDGWFRRSLGNVVLLVLYFAGVAPTRLALWYRRARRG